MLEASSRWKLYSIFKLANIGHPPVIPWLGGRKYQVYIKVNLVWKVSIKKNNLWNGFSISKTLQTRRWVSQSLKSPADNYTEITGHKKGKSTMVEMRNVKYFLCSASRVKICKCSLSLTWEQYLTILSVNLGQSTSPHPLQRPPIKSEPGSLQASLQGQRRDGLWPLQQSAERPEGQFYFFSVSSRLTKLMEENFEA